ncbi:hypothetical protein ACFQ3W_02240 [Paenibacillus puldeungensis]|uniref:DUF2178 domain-containing protein n=1 Tax=Paenibacillus puldeungensis TaxID=696536 RepID=A0ABW3RTT9_9BACL
MENTQKKPFACKLLIGLHGLLGVGAVFGGGALMLDPTGNLIGMPSDIMKVPLFPNYFIPGLILLFILGICPLLVMLALIKKWAWPWGEKLNIFRQTQHWAWAFSLYIGFALIIWIVVEVYIINGASFIHLFYTGLGLMIQMVTLLPSVSEYYRKDSHQAA